MISGEIIEVGSSFKYLVRCFNSDGGVQEDMQMRIDERLKKVSAM